MMTTTTTGAALAHQPVRIVRAGVGDVERLGPVFDAYRAFYGRAPGEEASEAFLRERIGRGESVVLMAVARPSNPCDAVSGGAVVGFVQLYPSFSSVNLRRVWILNDLYVVEAYRRRGVARQLMAAAVAHAKETGARSLSLLTEETNAPAQRLYEALAWVHDTAFRRYTLVVDG